MKPRIVSLTSTENRRIPTPPNRRHQMLASPDPRCVDPLSTQPYWDRRPRPHPFRDSVDPWCVERDCWAGAPKSVDVTVRPFFVAVADFDYLPRVGTRGIARQTRVIRFGLPET
jgi:hypothetical protein